MRPHETVIFHPTFALHSGKWYPNPGAPGKSEKSTPVRCVWNPAGFLLPYTEYFEKKPISGRPEKVYASPWNRENACWAGGFLPNTVSWGGIHKDPGLRISSFPGISGHFLGGKKNDRGGFFTKKTCFFRFSALRNTYPFLGSFPAFFSELQY
jgi:hypothetical protein